MKLPWPGICIYLFVAAVYWCLSDLIRYTGCLTVAFCGGISIYVVAPLVPLTKPSVMSVFIVCVYLAFTATLIYAASPPVWKINALVNVTEETMRHNNVKENDAIKRVNGKMASLNILDNLFTNCFLTDVLWHPIVFKN